MGFFWKCSLMPLMFISYMLQFLDKGTLGNAALFTLEEDTVSIGVVVLLFEKRKR